MCVPYLCSSHGEGSTSGASAYTGVRLPSLNTLIPDAMSASVGPWMAISLIGGHACREERLFNREEVLGRDATSVFPTESKTDVLKSDAAKELLGSSNRFITESEVGCSSNGLYHQHAHMKLPR